MNGNRTADFHGNGRGPLEPLVTHKDEVETVVFESPSLRKILVVQVLTLVVAVAALAVAALRPQTSISAEEIQKLQQEAGHDALVDAARRKAVYEHFEGRARQGTPTQGD